MSRLRRLALLPALLCLAVLTAAAASADVFPRPPQSPLELQIALARRNFSCGCLDGVFGANSVEALKAYQASCGLNPSGVLDAATRPRLLLRWAPFQTATVTAADLAALQPPSPTWLGKSRQTSLGFGTLIDLVAERYHTCPSVLRRLNRSLDWSAVRPGEPLTVPAPVPAAARDPAARVLIHLAAHALEPLGDDGRILAHFPISIAARVEKRPLGELHVTVKVLNPNYTVDPATFSDSAELRSYGRKLVLPPGPRGPVGTVWIGLDRPGYGIHGTPDPERIGRAESHGCFRLTNWDAAALLDYVKVGTPVEIEP